MIMEWRSIRTFTDLKTFSADFRGLPEDQQQTILSEMVFEIEAYRQKEAQTNLEMPPQAEKPSLRVQRVRRRRS